MVQTNSHWAALVWKANGWIPVLFDCKKNSSLAKRVSNDWPRISAMRGRELPSAKFSIPFGQCPFQYDNTTCGLRVVGVLRQLFSAWGGSWPVKIADFHLGAMVLPPHNPFNGSERELIVTSTSIL